MGKLYRIDIRHDGSGFLSNWFVDKIIIKDDEDILSEFICDSWLSTEVVRSLNEKVEIIQYQS